MDGINFKNHSCWDFKTLVVEGGMWIECTGENLPIAGEEPLYMVEIKDFKRGFDPYPNCKLGTDVRSFSSQLRVVQTQAILFLKSMSERSGSDIERL